MNRRFQTCPMCMQQFGSASIGIHVPQCYKKILGRWENEHPATRGPRPMIPGTQPDMGYTKQGPPTMNPAQAKNFSGRPSAPTTSTSSAPMYSELPVRGQSDNKGQQYQQDQQWAAMRGCRHCGRTFAYDRLQKHESVCAEAKGPRRKFNSKKQRLGGFDAFEIGSKNRGGRTRDPPKPKSNWRQEHHQLVSAIRSARQFAPPKSNQAFQVQAPGRPGGRGMGGYQSTSAQVYGGNSRGSAGGFGGGGGGGGGGKILSTNETSAAMQAAFGGNTKGGMSNRPSSNQFPMERRSGANNTPFGGPQQQHMSGRSIPSGNPQLSAPFGARNNSLPPFGQQQPPMSSNNATTRMNFPPQPQSNNSLNVRNTSGQDRYGVVNNRPSRTDLSAGGGGRALKTNETSSDMKAIFGWGK